MSETSPPPPRHHDLLALLLIATAVALGLAFPRAPAPREQAAPDAFAAGRAERHLAPIAGRPHAAGSAANEAVRRYLEGELRGLGWRVEAQWIEVNEALAAWSRARFPIPPQQIVNLIAERPGQPGGGRLLLMAHYDSRPGAPGAGDDGAAVAALLEVARSLGSEPSRNAITLLITDGEEAGLLGARAFVERRLAVPEGVPFPPGWPRFGPDPERPDAPRIAVDLVLNFEGRGARGPVILFQTSPGNRWLIEQAGAALRTPVGNSLAGEVYRRMPNNTDLTPFLYAGVPGVNFAFIGGGEHYHQPTDDLANLSRATLQHHGEIALAMTRQLQDADLRQASGDADAIYFDLLGWVLIRYGHGLAIALAALVAIAWLLALRGSPLPTSQLLLACSRRWLLAAALVALSWLLWRGLRAVVVDPDGWILQAPVLSRPLAIGIALALAAAWVAAVGRADDDDPAGPLVGLSSWSLLTLAVTAAAPSASFLLLWPTLVAHAVHRSRHPVLRALPLVACGLLVPPLWLLLLDAMTLHLAPLLGGVVALVLLLADPPTASARRLLGAQRLAALLAAASAGLLLVGALSG